MSPLERALLELVAAENWSGFRVDTLRVKQRQDTGAGRYTYLEDDQRQALLNGTYTAQGKLLQIEGVKDGMAFMVDVANGIINYLEIAVYGNESWNGVERAWKIV